MSIQRRNGDCPPPDDCKDCKDKDTPTQKSINRERDQICNLLYVSEGLVEEQQTRFDGENAVFKDKKCMFLRTEQNYRMYRNLEICAGTELLQTNESIRTNVTNVTKLNTDLNKLLTDITKQVKEVKQKFADFKGSACKLDDSITDTCNAAQWKALTGKAGENCEDQSGKPIDACEKTEEEIYNLICLPKGLGKDIDYIFQAAADVTGIQMFSNIDSLDLLQKSLSQKSADFEKLLSNVMKTRKAEVDKLQADLVESVKSITKSAMERNNKRSDFEGILDAATFLCCPPCDCITIQKADAYASGAGRKKDCAPRLKKCYSEVICRLCSDVQVTFCCPEKEEEHHEAMAVQAQ